MLTQRPEAGKRNVLITSALPYVNNVPHLGNIIGSTLSADVYARYCKLRGYNTLYICGTDEYGTATETKALEEGVSPRELCDRFRQEHIKSYDFFDIDFSYFGRTSCPEPKTSAGSHSSRCAHPHDAFVSCTDCGSWPHTKISHDIYRKLSQNGYLVKQEGRQVYCTVCTMFLADRYVYGTCPREECKYPDARGDQCDGCSETLNAIDLINPRCAVNSSHVVETRETEHMYIDLEKLQPQIEAFANSRQEGCWTENSVRITESWLNKGLRPRCITRDLTWGTPVPDTGEELANRDNKVFYVWFDAPIGYMSITADYLPDTWTEWWKDSTKNVDLVQFMGKDNVQFHTVMFPGTLMGTGDGYTLLNRISTTEFLNYEGTKFSKSRGVGVFGNQAEETGIPSEVWRYYLLRIRPELSDADFSWSDFADKTNNELVKNLGNFCHRTVSFIYSKMGGAVSPLADDIAGDARDTEHAASVSQLITEYIQQMENMQLKDAVSTVMRISHEGNKYMQDKAPWNELRTGNTTGCNTSMLTCLSTVRLLATVMEPFMPGFSRKVLKILGIKQTSIPDGFNIDDFPIDGFTIRDKPVPIFHALQPETVQGFREKFGGGE